MSAPNYYDKELNNLAATYEAALAADIADLKVAIAGVSESSIIGVGSGGSYTRRIPDEFPVRPRLWK